MIASATSLEASQDRPVTIYALADPRTPDRIRYIGKTESPLHRRLTSHVADRIKAPRNYRKNWVISLIEKGLQPVIWPIEVCTRSNWIEREQHWIWFFRPMGTLTNGTEGGEGGTGNKGWRWTPQAIARMSKLRKGKPQTPARAAVLARVHQSQIGRKRNPESIAKTAAANTGIKRSPETLERMRQSRIGLKLNISPEQRLLMAERAKKHLKWPKGRPRPKHSEEWKAMMSLKFKGRKAPWTVRSELNKQITLPKLQACNELRKVRIVGEDGRIFPCAKEAAKALGVSRRYVDEAIQKGWRIRGCYWRKIPQCQPL